MSIYPEQLKVSKIFYNMVIFVITAHAYGSCNRDSLRHRIYLVSAILQQNVNTGCILPSVRIIVNKSVDFLLRVVTSKSYWYRWAAKVFETHTIHILKEWKTVPIHMCGYLGTTRSLSRQQTKQTLCKKI